jgi:PAS domain S-box-containing protein
VNNIDSAMSLLVDPSPVPGEPPAHVGSTDALLEAQSHVLEMIVRAHPLPGVLDALCHIVESQAGRSVRAAILLADGQQLVTGAAPSLPAEYNRALDGLAVAEDLGTCGAAAARGEMVVTPSIAADPGWEKLRHLPLALGLQAAWSMPIVSSRGEVLGTFGTYFPEEREPTAHERRLVEVLARTAALALERQRADDALRESAARNRFLAELAAATQPLADPAEVMSVTARLLAEHLSADRCAYAEVEDERVFVITGDHPRGVPSIVGRWEVAAFGSECARLMREGAPYVVEDAELDARIGPEDLPAYRATHIRAVICVPLHKSVGTGPGRFTAAMAVHQAVARRWTPAEIELVTLVVARCWEALERCRVMRDLRESEARSSAIVEATPECVKLVAPDGTLLQMNAAGLAMLEAAEDEAIGQSVYPVVVPEHREAFRALNERVCQGERGTLQFDVVGRRGTRRSMETMAVPLPWPSGGFAQLAITRDVTERVAADRALEVSRARLDYAVRLSGVGFWYCDLPFSELTWDERVKEHFWLPPEARVTIDTFYARLHPDDREPTRRAIEGSIRERTSYDVDYRTVEPQTGAIKWIRALGGATYAADGTPDHFDGVTLDITARKLDQERLAQLLDREREQARLLSQVAQAALTIHGSSSLEAVLRVVTEQARLLIGAHQAVTSLTMGEDHRQAIHSISLSDKYARWRSYDTMPTGAGIYARVCQTNRPMRMTQAELEAHPAWRGFSGEGSSHPPMRGWLAVPFVGRAGANLGLVQLSDKEEGEFTESDEAILVQLAQIAAVAIENTRLYEELREQDRRKDEFLATLAHELRNPLAPIRTGLQILQAAASPEQAAKTREMMGRQVGHMVRMVDDLLDLSRITRGKVTLERQRVDLRAVLDSALETSRALIEAGGHEFAVRLPHQPLPLEVDPTRLAQVLANLLNNAAKYTPPGGRILLSAEREDSQITIRVTDTGIGIPAEMLPRVFDLFTQVGRSIDRSQGGLGVGLTLVRRLVELHEGSIEAESPGLDQGSTFTVRLPLAPEPAETARTEEVLDLSSRGPLRILVVDDNVDGAESLSMLLQLGGHETMQAHTGPDALTAAAAFRPELVFLDIGLPGANGYEVARRLRADPTLPRPVLVALTGWGTEEDRRQAQAAGFDRHLVKPVAPAAIASLLAELRGPLSTGQP